MIAYIYCLIVLYAVLEAVEDANQLSKGYFIHDHTTRFLRRALFVLSLGVMQCYLLGIYLGMAKLLSYVLLFASIFDQLLNLARGKEAFHLGYTAKWDKFWSNHKFMYICFTIIAFAASIYLNFYV